MAKQPDPSDAFEPITLDELASVSGGRMIPRQGIDPTITQGIQQLVKTLSEVGAVLAQNKEKSAQQTMQIMQQLMAKRGGG
jgi:hypothetical protein